MKAHVMILVGVAALGCKAKPHEQAASKRDAAVIPDAAVDWTACAEALGARQRGVPNDLSVLDACRVCELPPLLDWDRTPDKGGPPRDAILHAMESCGGFCSGEARDRFMGNLDAARGVSRAPWRKLADVCKDKVSARPEAIRFASATFFAFDRVARVVGAHGGPTAQALAAFDLPLPPLTISGEGPALPNLAGWRSDDEIGVGELAITLLGTHVFVGHLPHAHLDSDGVHVVADEPYPGKPSTDVAADLPEDPRGTVAIIPKGMPAAALVDVLAKAPNRFVRLARVRADALSGWPVLAAIPLRLAAGKPTAAPVVLDGPPPEKLPVSETGPQSVVVGDRATIDDLAALLLRYQQVHAVSPVTLARKK